MANVVFQFENGEKVTVSTMAGENLLETARKSNVVIDAPCSGNGSCGKCRVKLLGGELDSKKTRHINFYGTWEIQAIRLWNCFQKNIN